MYGLTSVILLHLESVTTWSTWTSTYCLNLDKINKDILDMQQIDDGSTDASFEFETNVTLESREILQELNQHTMNHWIVS